MEITQCQFDALKALASNKGNRFASLKGYASEIKKDGTGGKVANYVVLIGFSYQNAVRKSLEALENMAKDGKFTNELDAQAAGELIASCTKSLESQATGVPNEDYACKDVYEPVYFDGELINGVRYCQTTKNFNLSGLVQSEVVLTPGVYREVNSRPLTIAKRAIDKTLPRSKVRTFTVSADKLTAARINGETIEFA